MRPGDLILVRGGGLVNHLIRQASGGHYSHVDIYTGNGQAVGATFKRGVRLCNPWTEYAGDEWDAYSVPSVGDREADAVAKGALAALSTPYDGLGILGIWSKFVLRRLGIRIKRNPANTSAPFCSELASTLYAAVGVRFSQEEPSLTSPSEIHESGLLELADKNLIPH
jgi:hypothetical protein